MSLKTEDFLLYLCFTFDHFLRPTLSSVGESYEGWEYRQRHFIRSLRRRGWVEAAGRGARRRVHASALGRLVAAGGFDPTDWWNERWDGIWRVVTFDVPAAHRKSRKQILHWLKGHGFGRLQFSVWIHVRQLEPLPPHWQSADDRFGFLTSLDSRCPDPRRNAVIRTRAWDFDRINRGYRDYLEACRTGWIPRLALGGSLREQSGILREERAEWLKAAGADPFLPRELWPEGYLGPEAWKQHSDLYHLQPGAKDQVVISRGARAP